MNGVLWQTDNIGSLWAQSAFMKQQAVFWKMENDEMGIKQLDIEMIK